MNPTIEKLKVEKYKEKLILNLPPDITEFNGLIFDTSISKPHYDLIAIFIFSLKEFETHVNAVIQKKLLNKDGYVYFAYPKKGNKQYKEYIGRDDFFGCVKMDEEGYVNDSPVKFAKMASFSEVFTIIGLKMQPVKSTKSSVPSQCVDDYIERIPELENHFATNPEALSSYNNLTPGYRKDWARYVYSAQTDATVQKRLQEMEDILKQGYKTKDLFRLGKK